jgi:hypothetical protein
MKALRFIKQWQGYAPGTQGEFGGGVAEVLIARGVAVEVEQATLPPAAETADIKPRRKRPARKKAAE